MLLVTALLLQELVWAAPRLWHEALTGMPFVAVPKGCFQMGTPVELQPESKLEQLTFTHRLGNDEQPQHEVCVDAFLIGQYEVRADDWLQVMGANPPSGRGQEPAGGVRWAAAREFARRLTLRSAGKHRFRLPTEAEWEYACRAAEKADVGPWGDRKALAWYSDSGRQRITLEPSVVGKLKPNAWGLYDMLGNVWEWTDDAYRADAYGRHGLYNPLVRDAAGGERVIRGASHRSAAVHVRCAKRGRYGAEDEALGQIGLRLVRQP